MFIEALFTIARTWKQPSCPSTDDWIQKLWYIYKINILRHTKECIYAFESIELRRMNLELVPEWSQKEKNKYHIYEKWYWWAYFQGENRDIDIKKRLVGTAEKVESESEVTQLCQALCYPMDCSPLGSSIHGILQARVLEWGAIPFSRRSSPPRDWTRVSSIAGRCLTVWEGCGK